MLAAALLAACSEPPAAPSVTKRQQRAAEAEKKLSAIPKPRRYAVGEGELMVLEVPVRADGVFVDVQHCYVWRDRQDAPSILSCPQPAHVSLGD